MRGPLVSYLSFRRFVIRGCDSFTGDGFFFFLFFFFSFFRAARAAGDVAR